MAPRLGLGNTLAHSPKVGEPMLLDKFSGATLAFSVRKLTKSYTGYALKVRESGSNYEADVAFDDDNTISLSSAIANETGGSGPTLGDFVGAGAADNSAYVTTWYDQAGSSRDATNTTTAYQPHIVVSGAVNTQNSKPAIDFNLRGSDSSKVSLAVGDTMGSVSQPYTLSTVARLDTATTANVYIMDGDDSDSANRIVVGSFLSDKYFGVYAGGTEYYLDDADSQNTNQNHWFAVFDGDPPDSILSFNGGSSVSVTVGDTITGSLTYGLGTNALQGVRIGARHNERDGWKGDIQELIFWGSSQEANQSGITDHTNKHFDIF
jgi:hypothetical protein